MTTQSNEEKPKGDIWTQLDKDQETRVGFVCTKEEKAKWMQTIKAMRPRVSFAEFARWAIERTCEEMAPAVKAEKKRQTQRKEQNDAKSTGQRVQHGNDNATGDEGGAETAGGGQ